MKSLRQPRVAARIHSILSHGFGLGAKGSLRGEEDAWVVNCHQVEGTKRPFCWETGWRGTQGW